MSIVVKAYSNGDHVAVAWLPENGAAIPECRGFAVKRSGGSEETFLHSFVGFSDADPSRATSRGGGRCSAICGRITASVRATASSIR